MILLLDPLDDLRDHIARALHTDEVTLPDVLPGHLLAIVQVRAADRDAADLHRLHERDRGDDSGSPHARDDAQHACHLDPRRELVGERPTGMVGGRAELGPGRDVVQLDHAPVDLDGEIVPVVLQPGEVAQDLVGAVHELHPVGDPQSPALECGPDLGLGRERLPVGSEHVVRVDLERAGRREAGVELTDRAGGRVPRIRERLLSLVQQALVELGKRGRGNHDLAAQSENSRRRRSVLPQAEGKRADGPYVRRHVFAADAVAPRGRPAKDPVFVDELDRQAVELRLHDVGDGLLTEKVADPLVEAPQGRLVLR